MSRLSVCLLLIPLFAACGGQAVPPAASSAVPVSASAKPAVSAAASAPAKPAASTPPQASPEAAGLPKLTIPFNAISVSQTPLYVAVEQGLFKKYGVDVTTEYMANSPQLVAAMVGGQIVVSSAGQDAVVGADLNGGDIAVVATGVEKVIFSIYGKKDLNGVADLKGKKLGITSIGASTDFVGRYVLQQAKLEPEKDVAILQMGGQPQMMAGLTAGSIDAAVLVPPVTTQARKAGLKELANLAEYPLVFYQGPLDMKKAFIKAQPDVALNVMKGYVAGIAATLQNKQAALDAISKYTKTTDADELNDGYQSVVNVLPKVPAPKPEALKTSLEQSTSPGAKTADPASMVDSSLVDQLQKSGFIDSLYK